MTRPEYEARYDALCYWMKELAGGVVWYQLNGDQQGRLLLALEAAASVLEEAVP